MSLWEWILRKPALRQVLNFGHTIGHAIEKIYQISHGESVFWGMYVISKIFGEEEVLRKLTALSSPVKYRFSESSMVSKNISTGRDYELYP